MMVEGEAEEAGRTAGGFMRNRRDTKGNASPAPIDMAKSGSQDNASCRKRKLGMGIGKNLVIVVLIP